MLVHERLRVSPIEDTLPRSLLVTYLLSTGIDLIPIQLIDVNKHLCGLGSLVLPILFLSSPNGTSTIALTLSDAVSPYLPAPSLLTLGVDAHTKAMSAGITLFLLL